MTIAVRPQAATPPLYVPDPGAQPFWAAAAEGRLLIQECPGCGRRQFYPRPLCLDCGGSPGWLEASGNGTVYTFTVIRQNGDPGFAGVLPYVVAMIDLAEGPRMMGNVIGCPVDDVSVGMAVRAVAVTVAPSMAIVQWEQASGSQVPHASTTRAT